MLAGAYPSDEFAELKARLVWDRETGRVEGRRDARTVAITSGGTIPDRGLYPVFLVGEMGTPGRRVGELDEEMVYESRVGEIIVLGATSWRIEEIRPDRVVVSPDARRAGQDPVLARRRAGPADRTGAGAGRVRAGAGRGPGRRRARTGSGACGGCMEHHDLDELAAGNVLGYLAEEREAVGALPTDRRIVVERFRDELGDWRVVLLTPFGGRVHAPWALAIESRLEERLGARRPDDLVGRRDRDPAARGRAGRRDGSERQREPRLLFPSAEEVEDLVVGRLGSSAMFAGRFRENAARALLLPRRRPGSRTPLWQQRQRSAGLLAVASRYGSFPIIVETYRECLADVFDLPALREVLSGVARREIEVRDVETVAPSPFAGSLLFDYLAAFMYEGDAPLAERRAGALALDRELLRELLGQEELRDLIDPAALADLELALQALRAGAGGPDRGPAARPVAPAGRPRPRRKWRRGSPSPRRPGSGWRRSPGRGGRWPCASPARSAGSRSRTPAATATRLGVALPVGVPAAFLAPVEAALDGLVARWARSHGPFHAAEAARRLGGAGGTGRGGPGAAAGRRARSCAASSGRAATQREWCDPDVLRQLRRRSLARLRKEVEPVEQVVLGRFLPAWHGVGAVGDAGASGACDPRAGRLERLAERGRSAGRRADPGLGPGAGRPAGPDPRLPAAPAGRAGGAGRGGVGGSGQPGPRRRPGRAVPAGPRGVARPGRGGDGASDRRAPRAAARAAAAAWRVVLSRAGRRPPAARRSARSSTRCGTWSGPARSPTTRSRRCGPCAGGAPAASGGRARAGCCRRRRRRPAGGRSWQPGDEAAPNRARAVTRSVCRPSWSATAC